MAVALMARARDLLKETREKGLSPLGSVEIKYRIAPLFHRHSREGGNPTPEM
jgi:hypothetical protein